MAFKFPFTNYHELNLTWVLDQLKALFEKSEENVTVIENYDGRLTAVETELPSVADTAQDAAQTAAAAASLAQTAKATADTAQENAIQAQSAAGVARQEAQDSQTAADAAMQTAQQALATAQDFDGRITQAESDATSSLDKIGNLGDLITRAKNNLVVAINEIARGRFVPLATYNAPGVSYPYQHRGITIDSLGRIAIERADDSIIKSGTENYLPIVPSNQHISVFYGLARAAGDTTQRASFNAVGTYTNEAKAAIREMLGVSGGGGGGTTNYNNLINKPKINGVTLTGNKSLSDIGAIAAPSSPATGSFLVWNGTAWTAQTLATWEGGSY